MGDRILIVSDDAIVPAELLVLAVKRAGLSSVVERDAGSALARLRECAQPLVVDCGMQGAEWLLGQVRSEGLLTGCAVAAIVPTPSDDAFSEAFAWGADEVVPANSLHSLSPLVAQLCGHAPEARPPATRGLVLVASADARQRQERGRPLRNAGYEVLFALDAREMAAALDRPELTYAVIDGDLFADGTAGLRRLIQRERGLTPVLAVVARGEVEAFSLELGTTVNARVVARHAPPEDTLFVANSLLRAMYTGAAAPSRLLWSTAVSFRQAGGLEGTFGVSYNVSTGGLFVRSLTPPAVGTDVWIEVRPPLAERLVHLEAAVAWSRGFGSSSDAVSPPGFGVRITGGSAESQARWADGVQQLFNTRDAGAPAPRRTDRCPSTPAIAPPATLSVRPVRARAS